jgi:signal transduction histidine kinase
VLDSTQANFNADVEAINSIPIVPNLLEVICRTTGMGFAAIARVTDEKWITCGVRDEILFGLTPGDELKLETTICHEIRQSGQAVIIDHVDNDAAFRSHHTPAMYGFQSYISVPIIRRDGTFFGTLCAIDPKPAKLNNPATIGMFNLFADLISFHLHSIEQLTVVNEKLEEERKTAELREQFIAILGHDLRNPAGAILNSAQLLLRMPLEERAIRVANIIKDSSYRIKGLIENIMDFASGRLGGGITLNRNSDEPMTEILNHAITELQLIYPDRIIETSFNFTEPVNCDGKRIAQLFSNILSNAFTHGKADAPVKVSATSSDGEFILSVANSGTKIPGAALVRLFQPYSRGEAKRGQEGLGLGLYIASQIAGEHSGKLTVVSTNEETCFTLTMPSK